MSQQSEFFERLFGGSICCLFGAMFAWIGFAGILGRLPLLRKGIRIRGKVVDEHIGSERVNPIVEYEGQDGQPQRKEMCFASPNAWYVGGEIDLLYDPESDYIEPDSDTYEGWLFLIMSALLGTIGIWAGLSWLIAGG